MRLLHCISTLGGGGAERQLTYLAPELVRLGHDVHIASVDDGPNLSNLSDTGVILHRLASVKASSGKGRSVRNYNPGILVQLLRLYDKWQPDVVQTWIVQMHILGGIACHMTGIPWLMREASSARAYSKMFKMRPLSFIVRQGSVVVSNSVGGDRYWENLAVGQPRFIIRNGVDTDRVRAAPFVSLIEYGLRPEHKLILYAGRFTEGKNIENMMTALLEAATDPSVFVLLCGEGPLLDEARIRAQHHDASARVCFVGYRPDLWGIMKRANVFVSASHFEGNPNAVLEAMSAGCPLVLSDIPEHREFLSDRCAIFAPPCEPSQIAAKIGLVLSDAEAARARASAALAVVEEFSVEGMAQRYERLYVRLMCDQADKAAA